MKKEMKKLLLGLMATVTLLSSCEPIRTDLSDPEPDPQSTQLRVEFVDYGHSRNAQADTPKWESAVTSLSLMCFDPSGALLVQRNLTQTELETLSVNFAIPSIAAGANCNVYAVANLPAMATMQRESDLKALLENTPEAYNGTYDLCNSSSARTDGFVMSGMSNVTIGAVGSNTKVAINLKRTVAKVEVVAAISESFDERYSGHLSINSATITGAASGSFVVERETPLFGPMEFTHLQLPGVDNGAFKNLFYVYENSPLEESQRVLLRLNATYDMDGDKTTTNDQLTVDYEIELKGVGNGQLKRNGQYHVVVSIDGLTGSDLSSTITIAG